VAGALLFLSPRSDAQGQPTAHRIPLVVRVYVLWRHQHDEFEILGVFTTPEKFQQFVEKKFPKTQIGSRWKRGNGEWYLSTPSWEFVASPMNID